MKKRFASILLIWSLGTGMMISASALDHVNTLSASIVFEDVSSDSYYHDAVLWAVKAGITEGTSQTMFSPDENCTISQIITFLWRANGSPVPQIENPFKDIKETDYFYNAAIWAYENELVSGNEFAPYSPCTRGQTMLLFYLLAGSPQAEFSTFEDVAFDSVYSRPISWAVSQGIATGQSAASFAPDEICTRGQIVTFMYRNYGQANAQKSEIRLQAEKEIAESEAEAAEIEKKLHSSYIQADLNRYSGQIYQIWDDALNRLWGHLQDTLKQDEMDALREEELVWISYKEEKVDAAGNEFAGGSMEACARSMRGAELTKARVYELLEYLK